MGIGGDVVHAVALVPGAAAAVAKVDAMARRGTPRVLCAPYCNRTISAEARGVLEGTLRRGIRFVRDDGGFDQEFIGEDGVVQPIVAALDPAGEAAAAGVQVDDMVLSINGQTGLSNTQAAGMLRDLEGEISLVVRRATWMGGETSSGGAGGGGGGMPETPRSAMRRLV